MRRRNTLFRKCLVNRHGVATIWVIIASPAMLAMLVLVSDVSNLWLARVELENAVEAAALAGANVWGDGADNAVTRSDAHARAKSLAESNRVRGQTFTVNANDNPSNTNNNASLPGNVMLGGYNSGLATFDATQVGPAINARACYVSVSLTLNSLWVGFAGPFQIHATAVARYDAGSGSAKLVRIDPSDDPTMAP